MVRFPAWINLQLYGRNSSASVSERPDTAAAGARATVPDTQWHIDLVDELQRTERTTPPSTLSAAPLMATASELHRYTTIEATSSGVARRRSSDEGRMV